MLLILSDGNIMYTRVWTINWLIRSKTKNLNDTQHRIMINFSSISLYCKLLSFCYPRENWRDEGSQRHHSRSMLLCLQTQPQPSTVLMQSSNSVAFKAKDCFLWNISFMSALRLGFLLIYMFFAKRLSILILYRKKIIGTISGSSIAPIISYTYYAMIQDIFEFRASRPCSELEKI